MSKAKKAEAARIVSTAWVIAGVPDGTAPFFAPAAV